MKIIVDKIDDDRKHAITRSDVHLILSKLPPAWIEGIKVIRLSSSRSAYAVALYNKPDGILTVASRERSAKDTLRSILVELASRALSVKRRTFQRVQARYLSKIDSLVNPLMDELLPQLSQNKHLNLPLHFGMEIKLHNYEMPPGPQGFDVRFRKVARTVEYTDSEGFIVFTIDWKSEGKILYLEHHPARKQSASNYATAFERTKAHLESCGYRVEIFGALAKPTIFSAADVSAVIECELANRLPQFRPSFDFQKRLVQPIRLPFKSQPDGDVWNLWLVLEEPPETKVGYQIVFDEYSKQFGVVSGSRFLGFEGTFIQTLEAVFRVE